MSKDGDIYVADNKGNKLFKFTSAGKLVSVVENGGKTCTYSLPICTMLGKHALTPSLSPVKFCKDSVQLPGLLRN